MTEESLEEIEVEQKKKECCVCFVVVVTECFLIIITVMFLYFILFYFLSCHFSIFKSIVRPAKITAKTHGKRQYVTMFCYISV